MASPLERFSEWVLYSVFGLTEGSVWGETAVFFVYDSVKIGILLFVIIFAVSFLRSYLPPEAIKRILTRKFGIAGNFFAALIGTVTPFCSCSAVPLFIGFVESGIPLGVTFSYLVSAPMVNEVAAVLLLGLFGWKIALLYVISGIIIAVVTGVILGRMKLEHLVEDYVWKIKAGSLPSQEKKSVASRAKEARQYTIGLFKGIYPYVLLGVAVGAFVHNYVPENFLMDFAGRAHILAVPVAVLIGIPLYSNAAGVIPIVRSLIEKGLPLGTALSFMMAVTALSFPEMIILRKVLKPKLLALYIAILALGIIFTGYLFNAVL